MNRIQVSENAAANNTFTSAESLDHWRHFAPDIKSTSLRAFCQQLAPNGRGPLYVPIRPELLFGNGPFDLGQCYASVRRYRERVGGTFQHGWMIWQTGRLYLRAYHHCLHSDGTSLTDLCWQPDRKRILFVPTAEPGVEDNDFVTANGDGVRCRYFLLSEDNCAKKIVALHQSKEGMQPYSPPWLNTVARIWELEGEWHGSMPSKRRRRSGPQKETPGKVLYQFDREALWRIDALATGFDRDRAVGNGRWSI